MVIAWNRLGPSTPDRQLPSDPNELIEESDYQADEREHWLKIAEAHSPQKVSQWRKKQPPTGGITLAELARFLGVSREDAANWAMMNNFICVRKFDRWRQRVAALPPGLSIGGVCGHFGCSSQRAYQLAHLYGYDLAKAKRGRTLKVTPEQWAGVDWTQRDVEIARRLNISRERVRQVRNVKGKTQ